MKYFARLIQEVSASTRTSDKLEALVRYFQSASDSDKLWMLALFSGRRPKRIINSTRLRDWAAEIAGIPAWLFEESYHSVGDLAETIALVLPEATEFRELSLTEWMEFLQGLALLEESERKLQITQAWQYLTSPQRFVFNKLITGGFRIGVSRQLVIQALARHCDLEPAVVAHRISGNWMPDTVSFHSLLFGEHTDTDASKPYPFFLATALDMAPQELGSPKDWQAEWKWDGIRGQLILRKGEVFIWSRGEELLSDKFPELQELKDHLPEGLALDGEILPWKDAAPLPFQVLQTRIGRKNLSKKLLQDAPLAFMAYDLLEYKGQDARQLPLSERRRLLEKMVAQAGHPVLRISPLLPFDSWEELTRQRSQSRAACSEGVMIKKKESTYKVGRKRGDWWKWKVDPLSLDVVLVAAQKGHGRRANLYTDYTFAVRQGDQLVTLAKAYSGLTDKEFAEVDRFVKANMLEKFGPVRTVKPELVFEIGFEGMAASNRHKSGVALRFPRMLRWRRDKRLEDVDTLENVRALLQAIGEV
jgi:DNA ligase-1